MNRYNNHKFQRRNAGGSSNKQSGSNKGQPSPGSDSQKLRQAQAGGNQQSPQATALLEGQDDSDDLEAEKSERLDASFEGGAKNG